MAKHIIWKSEIDLDEWKDYIKEELMPCDYTGSVDDYIDENRDLCYQDIDNLNGEYLEDERMNLDIETQGEIICIADLGLWNGRRMGYKEMGHNIGKLLYSQVSGCCVDDEWYVESKGRACDFKCIETHHDGTNYYTYREFKPDLTDGQKEYFKRLLYNGTATQVDISRYTRGIGHYIQEIYGFSTKGVA